jgi:dihydroflavonol-4-reductase
MSARISVEDLVVVTGATGHLGTALVPVLQAAGLKVRAMVRHLGTLPKAPGVDWVVGDVLVPASLEEAFRGAGAVFHLAGLISLSGDRRGRVSAVNVRGTEHVARACLGAGVRRLVHCSSVHAYLPAAGDGPLTEAQAWVPAAGGRHTAYDRSKAEGGRRVLEEVASGLDAVLVHPTSVLGPPDPTPSRMGRFFLDLARRRVPALVPGGFDFVDVRDVAAGLLAAARHGRRGESYLLSGHFLSVRDLARLAAQVFAVPPPRWTLSPTFLRWLTPPLDAFARLSGIEPRLTSEAVDVLRSGQPVSHEKARRELGYEPRPLEETLRDLHAWFQDQGALPRRPTTQEAPESP